MFKRFGKSILAITLVSSFIGIVVYELSTQASLESGATSIEVDTDTHIGTNEYTDYTGNTFTALDEDGNVTIIPLEEIETPDLNDLENVKQLEDTQLSTLSNTSATYGVVVFNDMSDSESYTKYTDAITGAPGYTNGTYGPDAAYLGMSGGKVKFMISGVTGLCDPNDVTVYEYDDYVSKGYITNVYTTTNGRLYHKITTNLKTHISTQLFGYQQSYMTSGATYFSYDGHYFYNDYKTMITDYKNGVRTNSINAKAPYYNYYLFLSHRTKTGFTAAQMNAYISSKTSNSSSLMLNLGSSFITYQNTYGANGLLMFGLAINESSYGTSNIALSKNNLFGHGAGDSNPYWGSNGYTSAAESVKYHAQYFVSRQYTDVLTDGRYYGAHLGNKESGMNVSYASDPYWGEKAASQGFHMEDVSTSTTADYNNYQIGIVNGSTPIYNSPNGSILYYAKNKNYSATYNVPVVILDTVTSSGVKWYKIQSDSPVTSTRSTVLFSQIYNYSSDYAYVKASLVTTVNTGTGIFDSTDGSTSSYVLGDPSGDGKITSLDYILVKNHIMGTSKLTGDSLLAADCSGDGSVTSLDYIQIKNHIMGVSTIK